MIIFLDLDGVMIPAASWKKPKILADGFPAFSKMSVNALLSIISNETKIILSSSHRHHFSISEWQILFEKRGLKINDFILLPQHKMAKNRKDEILDFLIKNPQITNYYIIDDDSSLNDLPSPYKIHFIQTKPMIGLCKDDLLLLLKNDKISN